MNWHRKKIHKHKSTIEIYHQKLTFVPLHRSLVLANIDISINWNIKYCLGTN
jgi:hypothetical protein